MGYEIIKCTQYDLMKAKAKTGQMYFTTDSRSLFKDYGNNTEQRLRFNAVILHTDAERTSSIKPIMGKFYYVDETNSLWLFDTRWVLKIGNSSQYNTYYAGDYITPVINTDSYITNSNGDKIIDNNGLLGNGAVVVRNTNRTVRATLSADEIYNNITIKSYLNDGFLFIPNAHLPYSDLSTSLGALHLTVDKVNSTDNNSLNLNGSAYYYGDWNNYGDMYLIQENTSDIIPASYIPINDLEVVKYYISCSKIDDGENLIKTYFVIRPMSNTSAIIHLISIIDEEPSSVVQNDMGELIFTNRGNVLDDVTFECTRKINDTNDMYVSEYILENYAETIIIKQSKNSVDMTATVPALWNDDESNITINAKKWLKNKVLTNNDLQIEINKLKEEINQLKTQ